MSPLSLYVHIPWCERKCPYCDFNSHLAKVAIDESAYIDQLLLDLDNDIEQFQSCLSDRQVTTIFIGGGTPSLFSAASFAHLLEALNERLPFCDEVEVTLEANPGSSETAKFRAFAEAGINRLSIGVQSFNSSHLKKLGRAHDMQQAIQAAKAAKDAGFDNFNLDIMFGLPKQTQAQALEDLQTAIELDPSHLSCYQLTIEPNTLFHAHPPKLPDDDDLWEMQLALKQALQNAGYQQYEVSAYARSNAQCRHNLNYWQYGDYLGIGAGAHGKLTQKSGEIIRFWKLKNPGQYMKSPNKVGGQSKVAEQQKPFEFMLNAMRLKHGVPIELFERRTGLNHKLIQHLLDKHQQAGLIQIERGQLAPTSFGFDRLNTLLEDYLPDSS